MNSTQKHTRVFICLQKYTEHPHRDLPTEETLFNQVLNYSICLRRRCVKKIDDILTANSPLLLSIRVNIEKGTNKF